VQQGGELLRREGLGAIAAYGQHAAQEGRARVVVLVQKAVEREREVPRLQGLGEGQHGHVVEQPVAQPAQQRRGCG
jgi:hypothetical protein